MNGEYCYRSIIRQSVTFQGSVIIMKKKTNVDFLYIDKLGVEINYESKQTFVEF